MSAPAVWIILPAAAGVGLFFLRGRQNLAAALAGLLCLVLAGLALAVPEGRLAAGPLSIEIAPELNILGRQLVLAASERSLLVLLFSIGALWFFGAAAVIVTPLFPSIGLIILSIFVASLAVQPFLYAAVLIEIAVLISVPLLASPGAHDRPGLLRYLIFLTLGMPFILMAGWILGSVDVSPSRQLLLQQTAVLLGLGFAFWLAVFPLYSWVPLLLEEASPYVTGFVLTLLSTAVLLLGADFLDGFTWLRQNPDLPRALLYSGLLMVATAGVWAALQRNLARLMGYAFIAENGYALLSLAARGDGGMQVFATGFLPRIITLALWSLALTTLKASGEDLRLGDLHGLLRRKTLPALALLLACFSTGGLPLLAGFPVRMGLFTALGGQPPVVLLWTLLSSAFFLFAGLHMLSVFLLEAPAGEPAQPSRLQGWMLGIGMSLLLAAGLMPDQVLNPLRGLLRAFTNLVTGS